MDREPRISKCWSQIWIFWSVQRFSNFGPSPVRDFQNWVGLGPVWSEKGPMDHQLGKKLIRVFKNDVGPGLVQDSDFWSGLRFSKVFGPDPVQDFRKKIGSGPV